MLDTIRLTSRVEVHQDKFDRVIENKDLKTGQIKQKFITVGEDGVTVPRCTYYPAQTMLCAEVSLPKYYLGNNYELLDQGQIDEALGCFSNWVMARFSLADLLYSVSRVDYCYSWQVGDQLNDYLTALDNFPVSGYTAGLYTTGDNRAQGFSWRSQSRRANFYDKYAETKGECRPGTLRFECQYLNKGATDDIIKRSGPDLLTAAVARAELRTWLKRAGFVGDIKSKTDLLEHLIKTLGYEEAQSRYFFIEGYKALGSGLKKYCSSATYKRRLAEARKKGWFAIAEKPLKALEVTLEVI